MENETSIETQLEVIAPGAIEAMERATVDISIATAHRFPRPDLSVIKRKIISFATLDEETAEGCFYVLARGGKEIKGPSVRLAEMAMACYGNLNAGAREVANDGKTITVQAVCHDLENNVRVCIEVKRKITGKDGKTFNEDMQVTTGNAARSIALRNAVFKVIPMALIRPAYDAARATAIGDVKTLASRRDRAIETFGKMGVSKERVLLCVGKQNVEDIDLSALEVLMGLHTAIKDGDTSVDEAFPAPLAKKPIFESKPKSDAEVKPPVTTSADTEIPANKLERLMIDASIKFESLKAIIQPNKLCGRDAKSLDDMTDANVLKVIADWDVISSSVKAETAP